MYCQGCGRELPAGSRTCPACGFLAEPPPSAASSPGTIEELVAELKRTAKELGRDAAQLSQRVVGKAGEVAKDPPASAKRVTRKVAQELDKAAKEIDRILRDL